MTRTLKDFIEGWEREHMVSLSTALQVRQGRLVKPATGHRLAKAFGADEAEANRIAADLDAEAMEKKAHAS